jgi:hypothetical protein
MRPLPAVVLQLVALTIVAYTASVLASWYPLSILVLLLAQAVTTILVHCPAHYVVGRTLGIRFSRMKLSRSSGVRLLPSWLRRIGSLLVVFTLTVDPVSRKSASPKRLKAMFLAGVSASLGSAVMFALAVSLVGNYVAAIVTWLFAVGYLASDIKFSSEAGDVMRARAIMARP